MTQAIQDDSCELFIQMVQPWLDSTDAILTASQIYVMAFDHLLRYRAWNRFAEELTSIPVQRVLGRPAIEVFPGLRELGIETLMLRALRGENVSAAGLVYTHHITGRQHIVDATYGPLRTPSNQTVGVLIIGRDIAAPSPAAAASPSISHSSSSSSPGEVEAQQGESAESLNLYASLSARERQVLLLIAEGLTNNEVAERLFISVRTVEAHRAHIMRKLGLRSHAALIRYALRRGLVSLDK